MARENTQQGFLPAHGHYQALKAFRKSEIVFDLTYRFCSRFLSKGGRTIDQMVQAARSGKQNIVEGSKAAKTSKDTELKLTSVARASLEELLNDYLDFLRVRRLALWDMDSKEARYMLKLGAKADGSFEDYREFAETRPAEVVANIAICLVHQANFLLDRLIQRLERDFMEHGGLRERMTAARIEYRRRKIP